MMMQALATRDALRICKANTHRPDLFIHENGAWYLPEELHSTNVNDAFHLPEELRSTNVKSSIAQGNTFSTQSIKDQRSISTEDALEVLQSNNPRSDLFIHENGGISLDEFEIVDASLVSKKCVLS